ncbi:MAG: hypothetical protein VX661_12675 [Pseudomonadota bacterium]|jgi:hypothetical protein|nr:hypothetical protein [Pseudomonadota bacterium]
MSEKSFRDEIAMFALERLGVERIPTLMNRSDAIKGMAQTAYALADAMMEARSTQQKDRSDGAR